MSLLLPDAFVNSIPLNDSEKRLLLDALYSTAPTTIRVNTRKAKLLKKFTPVPWQPNAYYLPERPRFTSDPAFHAGGYYVQEASSMFLGHVIRQLKLNAAPLVALDLCAAPGGKSTLMRSELHPDALLIANEVVGTRANLLEENLIKWGIGNIAITQSEASAFGTMPETFDFIAVDAPCSGEGLFRKNPDAVNEWSPDAVVACAARQQKILSEIWPALKTGGILVYSTCTFNTLENEENVKWLENEFHAETVELEDVPDGIKVLEDGKGYRFFPHRVDGEGFYMAVVRKVGNSGRAGKARKPKKSPFEKVKSEELGQAYTAIKTKDDSVFLIHEMHAGFVAELAGNLYFKAPGFPAGKSIRNLFKPGHGLSQLVGSPWAIVSVDLALDEALAYLQREDVYKSGVPRGQAVISFDGFKLGFAKSDGNRLVSQYPLNWRIRSGMPDAYQALVSAS
jgi:16S rRNA C967 or C1407 C5-methylase (RsmB/RsmF family)/NOL1/NOP2/fmu family ribosome biogenesis protein